MSWAKTLKPICFGSLLFFSACSDTGNSNGLKEQSPNAATVAAVETPVHETRAPTDREVFKLNYALSLYAASQSLEDPTEYAKRSSKGQKLDKDLVSQRARDYLAGWNTRDLEGITAKLERVLAKNGTYSDPGETAHGVDEVAKTAAWMHQVLGDLVHKFTIAGEPELIEHTRSLYYNVENLLVYNWDWQRDGESVLHGQEMTIFNDDQMIHYDMGIFSTAGFPHFKPVVGPVRDNMDNTIDGYLSKLNTLSGAQKYQLMSSALSHSASKMNHDHTKLLTDLKAANLDEARFVRTGDPSLTKISIAYPWALTLGDTTLVNGVEVNVFDETGAVKYAFGFNGPS